GRWWLAAGCAAAATLARPEGAFVALPLLAIAWRQRSELSPVGRGLAAAAVASPAVALASFSLYLSRVVGDPLAWSKAQRAWGRHFTPLGVWHAFVDLGHDYGKSAWSSATSSPSSSTSFSSPSLRASASRGRGSSAARRSSCCRSSAARSTRSAVSACSPPRPSG